MLLVFMCATICYTNTHAYNMVDTRSIWLWCAAAVVDVAVGVCIQTRTHKSFNYYYALTHVHSNARTHARHFDNDNADDNPNGLTTGIASPLIGSHSSNITHPHRHRHAGSTLDALCFE